MRIAWLIALVFTGCIERTDGNFGAEVGAIEYSDSLDDAAFQVCDEQRVFQYYNFSQGPQYLGGKRSFVRQFELPLDTATRTALQSGYIIVRFIVNCHGEAGRYRIQQMNFQYTEMQFEDALLDAVVKKLKSINQWPVNYWEDTPTDYYTYVTFKILDGRVIEILP